MNEQKNLKKRQIRLTEKTTTRAANPWALLSMIIGFIFISGFIITVAASAQTTKTDLNGGDVVEVLCEGRGFRIERVSRTEIHLNCQGTPNNPSPEPTEPPIIPTSPPIEPTEPPVIPTSPPIEPTEPPIIPTSPPVADGCNITTGFSPLTEMGTNTYHGYPGGLYAGGSNVAPADYMDRAMTAVNNINPDEQFVLLSIGMSNAMREFETFDNAINDYPDKNPNMILINGAQTGQTSAIISDPNADYWANVDRKLTQIRLSPDDVRVVWLKEAHAHPDLEFPNDALQLQEELAQIVDNLNGRYPNLEIIYLSSRIYAGYATNTLNPEPYAYQSGFAVKWLIEEKMSDAQYDGPALLWGPYMWADGLTPRSDGLTWSCDDYKNDMTHPSEAGKLKVANLLLDFFSTDSTTAWFRSK